ncbi:MAG TPA: redoxin domain-containing protein [Acidimicrobiia bacterium]|nr:redoxin domain-containing protein [Acidimicrobiia bacterium]
MRSDIVPGATFPDYELPDERGVLHRLSDLQGDDPMVLHLSRGEHCPRERQMHHELLKFHEWCAVAYTSLVSLLPNDQHETMKLKTSTGASWVFLADEALVVQTDLDIREYTDTHHTASVPHTLVLAPGLVIDKIYVGYWFWGRPSSYDLWADLRDLNRRIRPDFDPLAPGVREEYFATAR